MALAKKNVTHDSRALPLGRDPGDGYCLAGSMPYRFSSSA